MHPPDHNIQAESWQLRSKSLIFASEPAIAVFLRIQNLYWDCGAVLQEMKQDWLHYLASNPPHRQCSIKAWLNFLKWSEMR